MKESLDQNINRNFAGLDDMMLKKILLAYYRGLYLDDTNILIELSEEDKKLINENPDEKEPFEVIKGNKNKGYGENGKKYLKTKGLLKIYVACEECQEESKSDCKDCEKIIYYPEEVLKKIYEEEYEKATNDGYKEEVLNYIDKCYYYSNDGIGMLTKRTITAPTGGEKRGTYENEGNARTVTQTHKTTLTAQNIEYKTLVSEYVTPIEFMVALIEYSESKEFVKDFIERVGNETFVEMKLYSLGYLVENYKTEKNDITSTVTGKATSYIAKVELIEEKVKIKHTGSYTDSEGKTHPYTYYTYEWRGRGEGGSKNVTANKEEESISVKVGNDDPDWRYTVQLYNAYNREAFGNEKVTHGTATWNSLDEDSISDTSVVTEYTINLNSEEKYDIAITEVKTWYAYIKQSENKIEQNIILECLDENGNWNQIDTTGDNLFIYDGESNPNNMIAKIQHYVNKKDKSLIWVQHENVENIIHKNEKQTETIFDISTKNEIKNRYDKYKKYSAADCLNVNFNWAIYAEDYKKGKDLNKNGEYIETHEIINQMEVQDASRKIRTVRVTIEQRLVEGIQTYEDNSDMFLGLLSNKIGEYKSRKKYSSDDSYKKEQYFSPESSGGKLVKYLGIYSKEVRVGKFLENGSGMLFENLENCEHTQGLVDTMKYIMYKYTGNNYGVTDFDSIKYSLNTISDVALIMGETPEEKIWCSLKYLGLSDEAIAGVMANIAVDSNFDSNKENKTKIGICQWSSTRRYALEDFAKAKDVLPTDLNTQIQYLIGEITEGGGCNGYAEYQLKNVNYSGVSYNINSWKNASTSAEAAEAFAYIFINPTTALTDIEARKNKATEYFNEFQGKTIEAITDTNSLQLKISEIAKESDEYGIEAKQGYCLGWVNDVYEEAGATVDRKDCAYCSGYFFGVSNDFDMIPIGAAVYGESSTNAGRIYGHVGIYIGNGQVADNIGYVRIKALEDWLEDYPDGCWGWTSSVSVNSNYTVTKGLIHAGRHN